MIYLVMNAQLTALHTATRAVNTAAYTQAMTAHEFWDSQVSAAVDGAGDPADVQYSAVVEVAVALSISRRAADLLIETGGQLFHRMPLVAAAFAAGDLDYASVSTIVAVFCDAKTHTVAKVEPYAITAAKRLTPGPLCKRLWRLWFWADPEEAAAARAVNQKTSRKVYVRPEANGLAWLSACITDLEGQEADRLINEIADTVCPRDPRSRNQLRADGLMALLHGEHVLACRCGDDTCPRAGIEQPARRKYLLQIVVDIKTLLGLTTSPGRLDDGTIIPAELVTELAKDARWQAILAELSTLANKPRGGDGVALVDCGRVRGAASIPPRSTAALRYRPGATVAAVVRAMFPTCTFPGCSVPSHQCELDHIDAFNHADPVLGGLTIPINLHPVCKAHHQLKTKGLWRCHRTITGVVWVSPNGLIRTSRSEPDPADLAPNLDTEPGTGSAGVLPRVEFEYPTWWETNIGADAVGPTLTDIAMAHDPSQRETLRSLRRLYLQHRQVQDLRDSLEPPPF